MSDPHELACWKCGATLRELPLPLGRRAECLACRAELHVCRMCRHYAPDKAKQCREPMAEEVKDKTRANFCDWFQPRPGTHSTAAAPGTGRHALEALFGGSSVDKSVAKSEADFATDVAADPADAPTSDPRADLDKLFGK